MSRSLGVIAAAVAALALALSACRGSGDEAGEQSEQPSTTNKQQTTAPTTAEPEPITAAEERWRKQVENYEQRVERNFDRTGVITQAAMRRSARLYVECAEMLDRAGEPGRFEPALPDVERACERLEKAAELLEKAIAATDAGGSVVVGTPEEKQFDRAFNGAFEAAGNAQYDLQRALGRAEEIERSFGS